MNYSFYWMMMWAYFLLPALKSPGKACAHPFYIGNVVLCIWCTIVRVSGARSERTKHFYLDLLFPCDLGNTECSPDELECDNGDCKPGYLRCDGDQDCPGGEDELNCLPAAGMPVFQVPVN